MRDISSIRGVVARARRRIRAQAVLDATVTALIPAILLALAGTLVLVSGPPGAAIALFCAAVFVILAAALVVSVRTLDDQTIARRIDRASDLSDRLSSAIAFTDERGRDGFRQLAIADGIRAVDRARVTAATRYRMPPATGIAAGCAIMAALAGSVTVPMLEEEPPAPVAASLGLTDSPEQLAVADGHKWYVEPSRNAIARLREFAQGERMARLDELTRDLEGMLRKLERDELTKEQLLAGYRARFDVTNPGGVQTLPEGHALLEDVREELRRLERRRELEMVSRRVPSPRVRPVLRSKHSREEQGTMGQGGAEASRRATIATAASKGFTSTSYKRVYADYERQNEEIMRSPRIPPGYRHVIRRYFDKINGVRSPPD